MTDNTPQDDAATSDVAAQRERKSAPADRATFAAFLAVVLHASQKTVCEITLAAISQRPEATVKIEAIPNEEENECRMVVIDVTAEREAQNKQCKPFI